MTRVVGFVGDVHGSLLHLERLLKRVGQQQIDELVFLGDYVNRGSQSREVIEFLLQLQRERPGFCTFLLGHHDRAFLQAIEEEARVDAFLRMGGAATLSSYPRPATADSAARLIDRIPMDHVAFLRGLRLSKTSSDFVAAHAPDLLDEPQDGRFRIFGHSALRCAVPVVEASWALIDTGCGTFAEGKLTCFLWPSRLWVQSS